MIKIENEVVSSFFNAVSVEITAPLYWWEDFKNIPNTIPLWENLLMPAGCNMRRTIILSCAAIINIYESRKHSELKEWKEFCAWVETLPYSEIITGKEKEEC